MINILVINPGSTSTKIAVFEDENKIFEITIRHDISELEKFANILDQYEFRENTILKSLEDRGFNIRSLDVIVARGGLLKPISSGVYEVNDKMLEDLKKPEKQHASNLSGIIAKNIADSLGIKAYIADPVVVDELDDIARFTGHPDYPKESIFHALNQKAMARRYSDEVKKKYEDLNLIVAHLGGGISVGVHKKGRVVDVNNALDGDGPFSPERSGSLPMAAIIKDCFSGKYSERDMMSKIIGKGGVVAYLGTNDGIETEKRAISGDREASMVLDAMAYQIAKIIGSMATVVNGKVDAIIITGGVARNKFVVDKLVPRIEFISTVKVYPFEDEMSVLAQNAILAVKDKSIVKIYN